MYKGEDLTPPHTGERAKPLCKQEEYLPLTYTGGSEHLCIQGKTKSGGLT